MKKKFTFLVLAIAATFQLQAQYYTNQNKIWAFGVKAGLSFTSGAPLPITTSFVGHEACASVCDTLGHLLFYTNGNKVWDSAHAMMPADTSITPFVTHSATQGALIIPVIDHPQQYYVFSIENQENYSTTNTMAPRMMYSIVDMSLRGGLGDIDVAHSSISFDSSVSEKAIAIPGDSHNIWLLTHSRDSAIFYAYNITDSGISPTPVISHSGTRSGSLLYGRGVLKPSHDRKTLVLLSELGIFELHHFNAATGAVSECMVIDTADIFYGAEFSPDNKKLYMMNGRATNMMVREIRQFDLSVFVPSVIAASAVVLDTGIGYTDLKLGPDSKIYLNAMDPFFSPYLDCIAFPNLADTACHYISHAITLPSGASSRLGMPNLYVTPLSPVDTSTNPGGPTSTNTVKAIVSHIYPNPANNTITIERADGVRSVSIFNFAGREVYVHQYNNTKAQIDVAALPAGIYYITVNGTERSKLLKE
jgi:hypothetical protein